MAAEVGYHPAIPQRGVECGDKVLGEGHKEHTPHARPLIEVVRRILDAAPLTADGGHCALAVETTKVLFTVEDEVNLFLGACIHECFIFVRYAFAVGLEAVDGVLLELFPVGLLNELPCDAAELFKVFPLLLPFYIILRAEEFGIRVFRSFRHDYLPSSL